ncbi:Hypothetical predicted protein [Mytilus galloprovincialis]|uniref:C1q domain-containing protein n=1 Tax=Mytilus galloprovincialis TaxID=29158 RepID=A0A8B6GV59_MYTGA|nr:Hypothetical predicted protein [Mytilus galloprovincialis]
MLYVCFIFLFTFLLNEKVLGNSCENDNCTSTIDIPLITHLNAPLKAELDISILTEQLKELIGHEVKQAVSTAMKDIVENIVDKRARSAVENLQTFNNLTISTFLQEMEDVTARKSDLRTMEENLNGRIEQMKEKQNLTESKLSAVEAEFERSTKRVAMTAHPSTQGTISNTIMKFDDVKYSVGITNLSSFKTTGKFTCEHEGLYLISASVTSYTSGAQYYIRLNGNDISYTYIGQHSGGYAFTGAVTVTRKLNPNDQVWLYAAGSWYLYSGIPSKLTIIKINSLLATPTEEICLLKTKQKHSQLLKKYSVLENEIIAIKNKTKQAEEKEVHQESINKGIDMQFRIQGEELNTMRNKSLEVEKEVLSLKQLANIKPLNAINNIQQTVNTLTSQTNSLRVNEQARSQDFFALFNMTVDTKKTLAEFSKNVNSQIQQLVYNQNVSLVAIEHHMTSELYDFRIIQNKTLVDIKNMVRAAENHTNGTLASLQNQISQSVEKVAMTGFLPSEVHLNVGGVVKFSDVKFSEGMGDLSSFKSTGKFKCGKSGWYIVSVTIEFNNNHGEFHIYVNGKVFTKNYKLQQASWWHSSSAIIAIELNINDTVWIQIGGSTYADVRADLHSRLTIIKIH